MRQLNNISDFEKNKRWFNEKHLEKKRFCVAREIIVILKPLKNWEVGLTINVLMDRVVSNMQSKGYRKVGVSKPTIYEAIKNLNLYRDDIFIKSDKGVNKITGKVEFRYYSLSEDKDFNVWKQRFFRTKFRNELFSHQLSVYEEQVHKEEQYVGLKKSLVEEDLS